MSGEIETDVGTLPRTVTQEGPVGRQRVGGFTPSQLARLDEALSMASHETGLYFTAYIGQLEVPVRGHAERLHTEFGPLAGRAVLVAVSPGQRQLEIVTGSEARLRLPDKTCALAAMTMTASFTGGDLTGGLVNGLRMMSDIAGHPA